MITILTYTLCLEYHIILGCNYYRKYEDVIFYEKVKPKSKFF